MRRRIRKGAACRAAIVHRKRICPGGTVLGEMVATLKGSLRAACCSPEEASECCSTIFRDQCVNHYSAKARIEGAQYVLDATSKKHVSFGSSNGNSEILLSCVVLQNFRDIIYVSNCLCSIAKLCKFVRLLSCTVNYRESLSHQLVQYFSLFFVLRPPNGISILRPPFCVNEECDQTFATILSIHLNISEAVRKATLCLEYSIAPIPPPTYVDCASTFLRCFTIDRLANVTRMTSVIR